MTVYATALLSNDKDAGPRKKEIDRLQTDSSAVEPDQTRGLYHIAPKQHALVLATLRAKDRPNVLRRTDIRHRALLPPFWLGGR